MENSHTQNEQPPPESYGKLRVETSGFTHGGKARSASAKTLRYISIYFYYLLLTIINYNTDYICEGVIYYSPTPIKYKFN